MPAGRPRKYNNVDEMDVKINEYFSWCDSQKEFTEHGVICKPYTISGLCIFLDMCYDTLLEYEKLDEFSETIKKAKKRVENYIEEKSLQGKLNPTVSIFNLKNNFGWKDKQEIESNNRNTNDNFNINYDAMSIEELEAKRAELLKNGGS